jgi:hypothetical protein
MQDTGGHQAKRDHRIKLSSHAWLRWLLSAQFREKKKICAEFNENYSEKNCFLLCEYMFLQIPSRNFVSPLCLFLCSPHRDSYPHILNADLRGTIECCKRPGIYNFQVRRPRVVLNIK